MDPEPNSEDPKALLRTPDDPRGLQRDADAVRAEMRVDELERRLKSRGLELEAEIRGKERLRVRADELARRVAELEQTNAVLHREAVSATALSRELDETLRVAAEARRQLGQTIEAERARRELLEREIASLLPNAAARREREQRSEPVIAAHREEAVKAVRRAEAAEAALAAREAELLQRDSELRDTRVQHQALRQTVEGHETRIEALRAELAQARTQALEASAKAAAQELSLETLRRELFQAMSDAERTRAEASALIRKLKAEFETAGTEAAAAKLELDRVRGEAAEKESARERAEKERDQAAREELSSLKKDLRSRAERELEELREALDAERRRLYADVSVERPAPAVSPPTEPLDAQLAKLKEKSEEERRRIAEEVQALVAPPSAPVERTPAQAEEKPALPSVSAEPTPAPTPPAAPVRSVSAPDPDAGPQRNDELRFLTYMIFAIGVIALLLSGMLLVHG